MKINGIGSSMNFKGLVKVDAKPVNTDNYWDKLESTYINTNDIKIVNATNNGEYKAEVIVRGKDGYSRYYTKCSPDKFADNVNKLNSKC